MGHLRRLKNIISQANLGANQGGACFNKGVLYVNEDRCVVCDTGVDNIGLPVIMTILEWTILQWTILEWAILEWTILGYLWSWQYRSKPYWEVTCDHDNAGGRSPLFGRHTAWETRPATAGHPWTATLGAQLSNTPAGHFKNHEQSILKGPWFQAAYFD